MDKQKRRSLVWLIIDSCIFIFVVTALTIGWFKFTDWYDHTIPVVPTPENTRLLWRKPELVEVKSENACKNGGYVFPYYGSTARYWYYARYSTTTPYETVVEFYEDRHDTSPFGHLLVWGILPPATAVVTQDDRFHDIDREEGDPPGETIILVEVSVIPSDEMPYVLWCDSILVIFFVGPCIVVFRHIKRKIRERVLERNDN